MTQPFLSLFITLFFLKNKRFHHIYKQKKMQKNKDNEKQLTESQKEAGAL